MKRFPLTILSLAAMLVFFGAAIGAGGEEGRMSDAQREQFVKDFDRTGMDTTPGDAMLLRILVEASGAKRGVEVGSYKGFGAINMGIAFERTGGHLDTVEINPQTADACRANLKKVGLQNTVTCITGDALKVLPGLEGKYDFVFIDARKSDYMRYFKAMEPKLVPGAVIVADNSIRSARAMRDFLDYLEQSPDYDTLTLRASMEKKDGMTVAYKIR
ncbi:MAG: class I SAM-dependent methyltransferase [Planctomycetota bacterium]|nr:class I SAM-dependent methyltransferase [Planctomycetota bacterium]